MFNILKKNDKSAIILLRINDNVIADETNSADIDKVKFVEKDITCLMLIKKHKDGNVATFPVAKSHYNNAWDIVNQIFFQETGNILPSSRIYKNYKIKYLNDSLMIYILITDDMLPTSLGPFTVNKLSIAHVDLKDLLIYQRADEVALNYDTNSIIDKLFEYLKNILHENNIKFDSVNILNTINNDDTSSFE